MPQSPAPASCFASLSQASREGAGFFSTAGRGSAQSAEPEEAAAALRALMSCPEVREQTLAKQRSRLADFSHERVLARAREVFGEVLHG